MKEYGENKWAKILFVFLSLPLSVLSIWVIIAGETFTVSLLGIPMLALFLYTLINPFVHKITLGDKYIAEKSLFKKKQIFFTEITHIVVQYNFAEIISAKQKIHLPRFIIENSDEIIGTVISKVKDEEGVLYGGDPIVIQSYINEFSGKNLSVEYDKNDSLDFTFVKRAELIEKRWLFRVVEITTSKGNFKITYFGKGMGYECVFVNDELVSKKDSHTWYVPNFSFRYQGINFSVNVRIYPWMTIRKFWIEIDNKIVYSE
jgi:hypothetical protein